MMPFLRAAALQLSIEGMRMHAVCTVCTTPVYAKTCAGVSVSDGVHQPPAP